MGQHQEGARGAVLGGDQLSFLPLRYGLRQEMASELTRHDSCLGDTRICIASWRHNEGIFSSFSLLSLAGF